MFTLAGDAEWCAKYGWFESTGSPVESSGLTFSTQQKWHDGSN
jgi:hypothetical protein